MTKGASNRHYVEVERVKMVACGGDVVHTETVMVPTRQTTLDEFVSEDEKPVWEYIKDGIRERENRESGV